MNMPVDFNIHSDILILNPQCLTQKASKVNALFKYICIFYLNTLSTKQYQIGTTFIHITQQTHIVCSYHPITQYHLFCLSKQSLPLLDL